MRQKQIQKWDKMKPQNTATRRVSSYCVAQLFVPTSPSCHPLVPSLQPSVPSPSSPSPAIPLFNHFIPPSFHTVVHHPVTVPPVPPPPAPLLPVLPFSIPNPTSSTPRVSLHLFHETLSATYSKTEWTRIQENHRPCHWFYPLHVPLTWSYCLTDID